MTIGIGAIGPNAGLAVFRALQAVEAVGRGSIGGFAAFAVLDATGAVLRAETQRGGTATLFTEAETTGGDPPPEIAAAPCAAVISSGPDRPVPLAQFLAAAPGIGLVTGHRLPNTPGADGRPVNLIALDALVEGRNAAAALAEALPPDRRLDAGLIALGPQAGIAARNSPRVEERPDLGQARRACVDGTIAVEVLHNAIRPVASLAALAAEIAMDCMRPVSVCGRLVVRRGCPVLQGSADRVHVGDDLVALRIETTDPIPAARPHNCAAIYLGSEVWQNDRPIGRTLLEPNVVVDEGRVLALNGLAEFRLPFGSAG